MSLTKNMWKNPRPLLTIERTGGAELGNCYHGCFYRITTTRPLSVEDIDALRGIGFIGRGQEFYIRGQIIDELPTPVPATLNWKSEGEVRPSGMDVVEASIIDANTGDVIPGVAIHALTKEPLKPMEMPHYIYLVEDRVDSGD